MSSEIATQSEDYERPKIIYRGPVSREDLRCSECGLTLSEITVAHPERTGPFLTGGGPAGPYVCTVCLPAWNAPDAVRARAIGS